MSGGRSDRLFSNLKNEFLRFNDLKPGSAPFPFWTLIGAYCLVLLILEIVGQWASIQSDMVGRVIFTLGDATAAFLVIPTAALFLRRYSDTGVIRSLMDRLLAFQKRNLIPARVVSAFLWLVGVIILLASWALNRFLAMAVLLLLAAIPSVNKSTLAPKSEVVPNRPSLPSLTTVNGSSSPPGKSATISPAENFIPPSSAARLRAQLVKPSKSLLSRVGFWLSLVMVGLSILGAWLPSTFENLRVEETVPVGSATTTGDLKPYPSPNPPPSTASATPKMADSSNSSGATSGDKSTHDDGGVMPAPSTEITLIEEQLDPRFRYCTHAIAAGYGPYYYGIDPEYSWYNDRDGDGIVCER